MNKFLTVIIACSFIVSADDLLPRKIVDKSRKLNNSQQLAAPLEQNRTQFGVTIAEPSNDNGLDHCIVPVIALTHNLVLLCFCKPKKMHESINCAQNCWRNFKDDIITESNRRMSYY